MLEGVGEVVKEWMLDVRCLEVVVGTGWDSLFLPFWGSSSADSGY